MTTLLHIQASPRKSRSASIEVADALIQRYQEKHLETNTIVLDLWESDIPELDQNALEAKYAGLAGIDLNEKQLHAWARLKALANYLYEADLIILSIPLWNFGIPYKLKQFIDLVSQKDILFSFDPQNGLQGLLHNKKAVGIYARGIELSHESNTPPELFDFQKPYIETWLKFIGISDIHSVIVDKTIFGEQIDQESRDYAKAKAVALADQL